LLHIGANEAQERFDYDKLGIPKVLWVEPLDSVFRKAKENLLAFPNQTVVRALISDVDNQVVDFNVSNNESQSSSILPLGIHKTIHPEVHYVDTIPMTTIRLDSLFNALKRDDANDYDFFVADVQGFELPVIKSLGNLIENFEWFYLEINKVPVYEGGALVEEIDKYLWDFGFCRAETSTWVADSWADGFYCKRFTNVGVEWLHP